MYFENKSRSDKRWLSDRIEGKGGEFNFLANNLEN